MQEIQVQFLGWEDPLEKETATHSSILTWKIPWTGSLAGYSPWGRKELHTTEQLRLSGSEHKSNIPEPSSPETAQISWSEGGLNLVQSV